MELDMEAAVEAMHVALKPQAKRLNDLNVYPVPDGDTGTNMLRTLEWVLDEVSGTSYKTPEEAVRAVARAALMGARGNSGVIMSQIMRGACDVLARSGGEVDAETLAEALIGARERAYSSIEKPVEGTMLTVIKDAAEAARSAVEQGEEDPTEVARAAAQEAHASVERTPELLKELREAGVVDAGGLGVAVALDGLHARMSGQEIETGVEGEEGPDLGSVSHLDEVAWGYCTQFVVTGFGGDNQEFRKHIGDMGKSVLVIVDAGLARVHLHTQDPGEPLSYARNFGRLADISIEDMEAQARARSHREPPEEAEAEKPGSLPVRNLGVVAVSRGAESRKLFESMGVVVVEGGQSANPSTVDLVEAVRETGAGNVILLPNNKNIVPTAEQVGELIEASVYVIPTKSIVGGLVTMVGFDAEGTPEKVAGKMREIARGLRYADVTRSAREAQASGREIARGAYIGMLDGKLEVVEESVESAAIKLAEKILEEDIEILTLLWGEDLDKEAAQRIAREIQDLDEIEVEVRAGGQPLYPLQMVAE